MTHNTRYDLRPRSRRRRFMPLLDSPLRWSIRGLPGPAETGPDVLVRALRRKLDGSRPAPHEEVAARARLHLLPPEEHWLGATLAAHQANRLPLDDLGLGVDARACLVTEPRRRARRSRRLDELADGMWRSVGIY